MKVNFGTKIINLHEMNASYLTKYIGRSVISLKLLQYKYNSGGDVV